MRTGPFAHAAQAKDLSEGVCRKAMLHTARSLFYQLPETDELSRQSDNYQQHLLGLFQ